MGLAVSQIRLLALTNRKADIENQVTIDSNRKMRLTRESSKLAETYYNKLQNTSIQYATSSGYEDVTIGYLMGYSYTNGSCNVDFVQQVATGSGDYAQKTSNTMILTDAYGRVIMNDSLSTYVAIANDTYADSDNATKAAYALYQLIYECSNYSDGINSDSSAACTAIYEEIQATGATMDEVLEWIAVMLENGGYQDGGTIYTNDGSSWYSDNKGETSVDLQDGYCYTTKAFSNSNYTVTSGDGPKKGQELYCGDWTGLEIIYAQYLGNLVSYYGTMLIAAVANGTASTVTASAKDGYTYYDADGKEIDTSVDGWMSKVAYAIDSNEITYEVDNSAETDACGSGSEAYVDSSALFNYSVTDNSAYIAASDSETLQAGLKTGIYTLCQVDDTKRGSYHQDTTLDYFINQSYIVEKTDSSEREEITAWYNAELADISEEETYWDTEITNLSTELESVNTEIESVKSLRDNAISSVFEWGQ